MKFVVKKCLDGPFYESIHLPLGQVNIRPAQHGLDGFIIALVKGADVLYPLLHGLGRQKERLPAGGS